MTESDPVGSFLDALLARIAYLKGAVTDAHQANTYASPGTAGWWVGCSCGDHLPLPGEYNLHRETLETGRRFERDRSAALAAHVADILKWPRPR